MIKVILISHGYFAKSALEAIEMIIGPQENTDVISVTYGKDLNDVVFELKKIIKNYKENIIIFTDILGGTPTNAVARLIGNYKNIKAFSGFNLPTLLTLFSERDENIKDIENLINLIKKSDFLLDLNEKILKKDVQLIENIDDL